MRIFRIVILLAFVFLTGCHKKTPQFRQLSDQVPEIFPDYTDVTIPYNIAPLDFRVSRNAAKLVVEIKGKDGVTGFHFKDSIARFPEKAWAQILKANTGDDIQVTISIEEKDTITIYRSFPIHVSADRIDDYLVYRRIMPGFQNWNQMGIYQRSLSTFREKTVIDSRILPGTCMNCHTFAHNDPGSMVFHLRESYGGTILYRNNKLEKLNTKAGKMFGNAAFPSWHPSEKYIAFSVNRVNQVFHAAGPYRASAIDMKSDIFVYDIDGNRMLTSEALSAVSKFETFPCFSPDGNRLYYCSADSVKLPQKFNMIRYSLCSVSFDPASGKIGDVADTLISSNSTGRSISLPRVSPDGRYLMFVMAGYGCFPSYNPEADLWILNLESGLYKQLDRLNSNNVESWHSWSSNGRWVVFSSRRLNGLHSNPFIAFIDPEGNPAKPFILPQKEPGFYDDFLFSFNVPEFITSGIKIKPYAIENIAKKTPAVQVIDGGGH
jgi:hypothetical protein